MPARLDLPPRTEPAGGTCVTEPGFDEASVRPAGRGLAFAFRARTESPVTVEVLARARRGTR